MHNSLLIRFLILTLLICFVKFTAEALENKHQEFSRSKEESLRVILEISFGNISIECGDKDKIAAVDYDEEETINQKLSISYEISNRIGTLRIRLKESNHFWSDDENHRDHKHDLDLKLSNAVPISFEIELGAGTGEIDLTDLQVKDMKISTGASDVSMKCSKMNPIEAGDISIKSGVSKFSAADLGNLNFHNLKFSGGIGSYKLDFNGKYRRSAEIQVEVGLGSIKIVIPKSIPAKLIYDDHWLSSFNIDDDFDKKSGNTYETENFSTAPRHITVQLESGLGSVKVRRE